MTQPAWSGTSRNIGASREVARTEPANLADILERVLDKGIVIVGDIRINLLDIELLTIKIRLIVASVDRAREMGIDWWEHDPALSSGQHDVLEENRRLRQRIDELQAGQHAHPDGEIESGSAGQEEHREHQEHQKSQEHQKKKLERSSHEHHQDGSP
ncbi:MAG: gas vesicle protein [Streptomycetaceae bacterium]|nr:gas vesicle protein [Streptomycetaceae bacterium]